MTVVKLALVMGGGVSLGSYIAGAMYELLFALEGNRKTEPGIEIDVLTGASAGSITAAMVAYALLYDVTARANLRTVWVEDIDMRRLLEEDPQAQSIALLSERKMRELADRVLTPPDPAASAAAPYCAAKLRMAFTLSNLEGTPYRILYNNRPQDSFETVVHSDWQIFELPKNPSPAEAAVVPATWASIRNSALASGSFPFAFQPKYVTRRRGDYRNAALPPAPEQLDILCTDGGTFNNEPLGIAKDLVERNPEHRRHQYRYVLIDPYLSAAAYKDYTPPDPPNLIEFGQRLIAVILGESTAHDWLQANKVNKRLELERQFTPHLANLIAYLPQPDVDAMKNALRRFSEDIARFKKTIETGREPSPDDIASYLEANVSRVREDTTFRAAVGKNNLTSDSDREAVFAHAIFALENVAGLRDKETMDLYLIAPQGDELAGNFMFNFGGFFRRAWRDHDFRKGRKHARQFILDSLSDCVEYEPAPAGEYDPPPLETVGLQSLTDEERATLRPALDARLDRILGLLGFGWFKKGLVNLFLRGRVYRFLGLES